MVVKTFTINELLGLKTYYQKNKSKIIGQQAAYYQKNREKIKARAREYRLKNREKLLAKRREKSL